MVGKSKSCDNGIICVLECGDTAHVQCAPPQKLVKASAQISGSPGSACVWSKDIRIRFLLAKILSEHSCTLDTK